MRLDFQRVKHYFLSAFGQVFAEAFYVEFYGFAEIRACFIQRAPLCGNTQLDAACDVPVALLDDESAVSPECGQSFSTHYLTSLANRPYTPAW